MSHHMFAIFLSAALGAALAAIAPQAAAQDAAAAGSVPAVADTSALAPPAAAGTAAQVGAKQAETPAATDATWPTRALGPDLSQLAYPYPVRMYRFESQRQSVQMAYMDVEPTSPDGQVALLLQGSNFCSNYWHGTIKALTKAGYRVIAPDQIGLCKSSKPSGYQYSFQQLAANTHALLDSLQIGAVTVVGHSMGGMLAVRYALMYPRDVDKLVLVDPLGLQDWQAAGVPWRSIDDWYAETGQTTLASIRAYQKTYDYGGTWTPAYARLAEQQSGMYEGEGHDVVAWAAARIDDMVYTQPVVHALGRISVPTTLIIGQEDHAVPDGDIAPADLAHLRGDVARLGVKAARTIPDATLITLAGLGHVPQIQDPQMFEAALYRALGIEPDSTPGAADSSGVAPVAGASTAPAAESTAPSPAASAAPATSASTHANSTTSSDVNDVMNPHSTDGGITPAAAASVGAPSAPATAPATGAGAGPR